MKKRTPNQGYTLIEVLIAMSIFAVGFLAVASMQIMSITQNAKARMQTEATAKAVDRLERLMALPYDHTDLNELSNPHRVMSEGYKVEWIVEDDVPINAAKSIKITVSAASRIAAPISISFIIARRLKSGPSTQ
jgi:prepilin-type N-terminal cleavage/methylation domain-containing protein